MSKNRIPTDNEKDLIVQKLVEMSKAGKLAGVWPPTHAGVSVKEFVYSDRHLLSWREAGALTGVTTAKESNILKMRKRTA